MKLLTFRPARARSGHFGVLLPGNRVLDVTALAGRKLPATLLGCIEDGEAALAAVKTAAAEAQAALTRGEQPMHVYALDAVTLEPPFRPGKIMAVGRNYADHVAEGVGQAYTRVAGFIKLSSCVVAHGATVRKPAWTESFDYENELAIVIGRTCSDVPPETAYDVVFGYTIMNDLSCRDVQYAERKEGNICIGKSFPTAAPLGPWIVTKDEIPDPHNLRISLTLNGETMQDSNTSNLIFKVPFLVSYLSQSVTWEVGDLISTGTPPGVGFARNPQVFMKAGDSVSVTVEGIGTLTNPVAG